MGDFNDALRIKDAAPLKEALGKLRTEGGAAKSKTTLQRNYGMLPTAFWSDKDFKAIRSLTDRLFKLYIYLHSSPYGNSIGLYRLTIGALADDLVATSDQALEDLKNLEASGLIMYDKEDSFVWVINQVECQITYAKAEGNAAIGMAKVFRGLPDMPLKQAFGEKYRNMLPL